MHTFSGQDRQAHSDVLCFIHFTSVAKPASAWGSPEPPLAAFSVAASRDVTAERLTELCAPVSEGTLELEEP